MNYVWIVELLEGSRWVPCDQVYWARAEGRKELKDWRLHNPGLTYRLSKYVRAES